MTRPKGATTITVEENCGANELNGMEHLPLLVEKDVASMTTHTECEDESHNETEVNPVAGVPQKEKCPLGQKISSSSCSPIETGVNVENTPQDYITVDNETNTKLVRTNDAP